MTRTLEIKSGEIDALCVHAAKQFDVQSQVHSDDLIFKFCINHDCFDSSDKAVNYYFRQGGESAEKLSLLINKYISKCPEEIDILEFASGYGAVTRHLTKKIPNAKITACDIHDKAVEFIKDQLGVQAEKSHDVPESLKLQKKYDVVFALSFFSHMPEKTWGRWLQALAGHVKNGGLLIFTTHGEVSRKNFGNPEISESGFWFKSISEQHDLDLENYGMTVTLEKFVAQEIKKLEEFSTSFYQEAFWWEHQDVYVLTKGE